MHLNYLIIKPYKCLAIDYKWWRYMAKSFLKEYGHGRPCTCLKPEHSCQHLPPKTRWSNFWLVPKNTFLERPQCGMAHWPRCLISFNYVDQLRPNRSRDWIQSPGSSLGQLIFHLNARMSLGPVLLAITQLCRNGSKSEHFIKPRQGFLAITLCVRPSVCVCVCVCVSVC